MEFVSEIEKIMKAIELNFPPSPAFGHYKDLMPKEAVSHPAKANVYLLEFLIKNLTKEGDVILDPMAGTGSTGVIAALHNRNAIQVEIEKKFYEFMEKARENVEKMNTLLPKGWIRNILGDSRYLSELLKSADVIITSPPYSNTDIVKKNSEEFWEKAKELGKRWGSKPPSGTEEKQYSSPNNIANLPYIDTIITSPPYLKSAEKGAGINKQREKDVKIGCSTIGRLVDNPNAIDNTKEYGNIDVILTSPPYADAISKQGGPVGVKKVGISTITAGVYSADPSNIGNLKGETYLEAMFKVYSEMFKVLKPNGLAIIIVKPFIRKKKVVDLPYHTYLLMNKVGFRLEKLYKLRLKAQSFWRILYFKKNPNVPVIAHEYILVCRKY
jgi:DNA modification methylase